MVSFPLFAPGIGGRRSGKGRGLIGGGGGKAMQIFRFFGGVDLGKAKGGKARCATNNDLRIDTNRFHAP